MRMTVNISSKNTKNCEVMMEKESEERTVRGEQREAEAENNGSSSKRSKDVEALRERIIRGKSECT